MKAAWVMGVSNCWGKLRAWVHRNMQGAWCHRSFLEPSTWVKWGVGSQELAGAWVRTC